MSTHIYMWNLKYALYFASKQICHFVLDEPGFHIEYKIYFKYLAHLGCQTPFCNSVFNYTISQHPIVPEQVVFLLRFLGTISQIPICARGEKRNDTRDINGPVWY